MTIVNQHLYKKEVVMVPVKTCYYDLTLPGLRYVNHYPYVNPKQNEWFFDGYYWITNADTGAPIGFLRLNGVVVSEPEASEVRARFTRGEQVDSQPTSQTHRICETVMVEE